VTAELEATGRNVYLLQTSLERVCKAARRVVNHSNGNLPEELERDMAILSKALASK
jgi:hypothetical protein